VRERSTLRVRTDGTRSILTFKAGAARAGEDPRGARDHRRRRRDLQQVLARLGMRVWFQYSELREEFTHADVIIAVDDADGTFVEIEGPEAGIMAAADAMGRTPADFISTSARPVPERHRSRSASAAPA
jgi:adenylate cyclase class IV